MKQAIENILSSVTENSTAEQLSAARKNLFAQIEDRVAAIQAANKAIVRTNESLSSQIRDELGQLVMARTPSQLEFLGSCLWVAQNYNTVLASQIASKTTRTKAKLGYKPEENPQLLLNTVDFAYRAATSVLQQSVEKISQKLNQDGIEVQAREPVMRNEDEFSSSIENHKKEIDQIPFIIQFERNIANISPLWDNFREAFNLWARSGKNADLENALIAYYKFNSHIYGLGLAFSEEFGAEDVSLGLATVREVLMRNHVDIRLTVLSESKARTFRDLEGAFIETANADYDYTKTDLQPLSPNLDNPIAFKTSAKIPQEISGMMGSAIRYFIEDNSPTFVNSPRIRGEQRAVPASLEKLAKKVAVTCAVPLKSTYLTIDIVKEVVDRQAAYNQAIKREIKITKIAGEVVADPALDSEAQGSIRHRIEVQKYTISDQETKLLAKVVGPTFTRENNRWVATPLIKLLPRGEITDFNRKNGIKTYREFIAETKEKIAQINARNSRRFRFSLFRERTDHLKAAADFVQQMQFKYSAAIKPAAILAQGLHRSSELLSNKLVRQSNILSDKMNSDYQNLTQGSTFRHLFAKTVASLSNFFSENRALKTLSEVYNARVLELNKEKRTTGSLPSKAADTSKMSTKKAVKETQSWLQAKSQRNTNTHTNFKPGQPLTAFYSLVGGINLNRVVPVDIQAKTDSYMQGLKINELHPQLVEQKNTLFNLQSRLINLHEKLVPGLDTLKTQSRGNAETIASTTAESYNQIINQATQIDVYIKRLQEKQAEKGGDSNMDLVDYLAVFLPEADTGYPSVEAVSTAVFNKIKELTIVEATLFGQAEKLMRSVYTMDDATMLTDLRKITYGQLANQVNELKTGLANLPRLGDDFQIKSATTLPQLSQYVASADRLLTDQIKKLEKIADSFLNYLTAEIDARKQLANLLQELDVNDPHYASKMLKLTQAAVDSLQLIDRIQFLEHSHPQAKPLAIAKIKFISGVLKKIEKGEITLDQFKKENTDVLSELEQHYNLEKGALPLMIKTAKTSLEDFRYRAAHTTAHFGIRMENNG